MDNNKNGFLFYESIEDAIEKAIIASGKTKKEIASILFPDCQIETAKSRLSRALSPEHHDVNISTGHVDVIMKIARPDDIIFYYCDQNGFNRPEKKTSDNIKKEIQQGIQSIQSQLKIMIRSLPAIEDDTKS